MNPESEIGWLAAADQARQGYERGLNEMILSTRERLAEGHDSTKVWSRLALDLWQMTGSPSPWLACALVRLAERGTEN